VCYLEALVTESGLTPWCSRCIPRKLTITDHASMQLYSLHFTNDETGRATNRGILWANKYIVKVTVAKNYL